MSTKIAKQAGLGGFIDVKTKDYAGTVAVDEAAAIEMIKLVGVKSNEFHNLVARAAAAVVIVGIKHGSVSPANLLIENMGEGMRKNTMRDWLIKFGPFRYDEKTKAMVLNKDRRSRLQSELDKIKDVKFASKLVANPYWKWKKEATYKEFNFARELSALMAKANKLKLGDTKGYDPNKIDLDGMDEVVKVIPLIKVKAKAVETKAADEEAEGQTEDDSDEALRLTDDDEAIAA